jgi:hypothetical protein
MLSVLERYSRSFLDALSLARNRRDQATIYYCKDGERAVYDVTKGTYCEGALFIRGRCVSLQDMPPELAEKYCGLDKESAITIPNAHLAKRIFEHNGIDVSTGWDLKP